MQELSTARIFMTDKGHEDTNLVQERAERVRQLRRRHLGLSRPQFSVMSDIPADTLRNWEQGRYGGLTEKGARKLVAVFQKRGVQLSVEWLLYGIGRSPIGLLGTSVLNVLVSDEKLIPQELDFFHQLNPDAVDYCVVDDRMLPCFLPGDYIAGRWIHEKNINKALGKPCIVKTIEGFILFGLLALGMQKNRYNLHNSNTSVPDSLNDLKVYSVAPVLWVRRKAAID